MPISRSCKQLDNIKVMFIIKIEKNILIIRKTLNCNYGIRLRNLCEQDKK
jgi:hypothetical protein